MEQNSQIKFNDEEMAKHAKCFNQFCAKNNIASLKICIVLLMFIMMQVAEVGFVLVKVHLINIQIVFGQFIHN